MHTTRSFRLLSVKREEEEDTLEMQLKRPHTLTAALAFGPVLASSAAAQAATVANPLCPKEIVSFNPAQGQDIVELKNAGIVAPGCVIPKGE